MRPLREIFRVGLGLESNRRLEVRHYTASKEFQRPECFAVLDPAKIDLHRRLVFSDEITVELHLLDYFFGRADQRV